MSIDVGGVMGDRRGRVAYLYASGDGVRIGDPDGPHMQLRPSGVEVSGVGLDGSFEGGSRRAVAWESIRALRVQAPVSEQPAGWAVLRSVLVYATGLGDGSAEAASVDVTMDTSLVGLPSPWEFSLPGPLRKGFRRREVERADLILSELVASPSFRRHLADPARLVNALRDISD